MSETYKDSLRSKRIVVVVRNSLFNEHIYTYQQNIQLPTRLKERYDNHTAHKIAQMDIIYTPGQAQMLK
jgi:hypothetical protein